MSPLLTLDKSTTNLLEKVTEKALNLPKHVFLQRETENNIITEE